jgi:hypothetical protein
MEYSNNSQSISISLPEALPTFLKSPRSFNSLKTPLRVRLMRLEVMALFYSLCWNVRTDAKFMDVQLLAYITFEFLGHYQQFSSLIKSMEF